MGNAHPGFVAPGLGRGTRDLLVTILQEAGSLLLGHPGMRRGGSTSRAPWAAWGQGSTKGSRSLRWRWLVPEAGDPPLLSTSLWPLAMAIHSDWPALALSQKEMKPHVT